MANTTTDMELRIIKRQRVELAEEMLSVVSLADRWHCHPNTVRSAIKRYRETAGRRGLLCVGSGRATRVPARAANRYAASDDFLHV